MAVKFLDFSNSCGVLEPNCQHNFSSQLNIKRRFYGKFRRKRVILYCIGYQKSIKIFIIAKIIEIIISYENRMKKIMLFCKWAMDFFNFSE